MVKVHGADSCGGTQWTLSRFNSLGVPCDHTDVKQDPKAAKWVKQHNEGKEHKPTVYPLDRVLSVISNAKLDAALCDNV